MPRIISDGTYHIYLYAQDHPPPHCHVHWDGDKVGVVELTNFSHVVGDRLPRIAMDLVRSNQDVLIDHWNQLNP